MYAERPQNDGFATGPALGVDVSLCIEVGWSLDPSIADCTTRANSEEDKGVRKGNTGGRLNEVTCDVKLDGVVVWYGGTSQWLQRHR